MELKKLAEFFLDMAVVLEIMPKIDFPRIFQALAFETNENLRAMAVTIITNDISL